MKITILNGNPDSQNTAFDTYITMLVAALTEQQHESVEFILRDMDIKYCTGCFGCWVKKPGECVVPDASHEVTRAIINSDFLLWASPLRMGFPCALLKTMMDKSIPLIHPYFVVDRGEAHHRPRYDHYPRIGLLMQKEADTSADDLAIVSDILSRTALNMKSRLEFAFTTDNPVTDVARAIIQGSETGVPFQRDLGSIPGWSKKTILHLTVLNGSPRGQKSNTSILLQQVIKGFTIDDRHTSELHHLAHRKELKSHEMAFANAEAVLIGFPLYTDAMPGIVKAFIEKLAPLRGRKDNPPIGFLVQSGFPESVHSRHVERYLEQLALRLGSDYMGTLIKGGCEGVRLMPESMNRKLFDNLIAAGQSFAVKGYCDSTTLNQLAKPERYPKYLVPVFKLLSKTQLLNGYWNNQLKKNGVYEQRFAKPFAMKSR